MATESGRFERLDRRLERIEDRQEEEARRTAAGFERLSSELAGARAREKERLRWFTAIAAMLSGVVGGIAVKLMGLFGKH